MLNNGEILSFYDEQTLSFNDDCIIYSYNGNLTGTDGQLSPYYITGSTQVCGFRSVRSGKVFRGQLIYPSYDAELRLPITLIPDTRSLIVFASGTYSIDGVNIGRTANVLNLNLLDI